MTRPYRIKHKASGLYYKPSINHINLSKNGKVYMTNNSPLLANDGYDYIHISVKKGTKIHNILEKSLPLKGVECFYGTAVWYKVPKSEFEKEELYRMKNKVLTITVRKQWLDMIAAGEKTEEYREIKPYWASRLVNQQAESSDVLFDEFGGYCRVIGKLEYKTYTHIIFINGYRKDSPRIEKEIESITIGNPKKGLCPDKWLDKEFFVIKFK